MVLPGRVWVGRGQGPGGWFEVFWWVVCLITALQFFWPAYFALGYLRRLRGVLENCAFDGGPAPISPTPDTPSDPDTFCHAIVPFGVHLTFFGVLAAGMLVIFLTNRLAGGGAMPFLVLPTLLLMVFGPVVFNYLPSPFQKQRRVLETAAGGGSIFMMNGSWPFFRLLVYEDGIEIRFFLHAWFIPYVRLESVSLERVFVSRALLIRSDLPKVPDRIRFYSSRQNDLLAQVEEGLARHRSKSSLSPDR